MHVVRTGSPGGGMEKGIINVANRLPVEFRVSICALDEREEFSSLLVRPGAEFHVLPSAGGGADRTWITRLARLFRSSRVDIVHSHQWGTFLYSVLAARWAGTRIVHGEHGKNLHELTEKNWKKVWTRRILGRFTDRVVTVSEPLRREWIERYWIPPDKAIYLPNGVDLGRFANAGDSRAENRRRFGLPEDAFVIGSVGRFDPIKNYPLLLRTAPLLNGLDKPIVITLLGDGPLRPELEKLAKMPGIAGRIYFLGQRPDVEKFLASLDIFTLPSLSEGMSNVVLEAMAAGLPVVCPDISGHRPLIDPAREEGVLLDPYTEETLARAFLDLLRDPARLRRLSENSRRKIQQEFTLDRMVSRHAELYWQAAG